MDEDLSCCLGCVLAIFLIFAGFSLISNVHLDSDDLTAENIYLADFDSGITQYGSNNDYMYHAFYNLKNVSTSFEDSKVITYFYSEDKVVLSDEVTHLSNNTTQEVSYDDISGLNMIIVSSFLHSDNFTNITHVKIVLMKDEEIIFNTTHPFDMKNFKIENLNDTSSDGLNTSSEHDHAINSSDDTTSSSDSGSGTTYVASQNSDKFHHPSCSYARKIKPENKITFSNREEAINAGYKACQICYP